MRCLVGARIDDGQRLRFAAAFRDTAQAGTGRRGECNRAVVGPVRATVALGTDVVRQRGEGYDTCRRRTTPSSASVPTKKPSQLAVRGEERRRIASFGAGDRACSPCSVN